MVRNKSSIWRRQLSLHGATSSALATEKALASAATTAAAQFGNQQCWGLALLVMALLVKELSERLMSFGIGFRPLLAFAFLPFTSW